MNFKSDLCENTQERRKQERQKRAIAEIAKTGKYTIMQLFFIGMRLFVCLQIQIFPWDCHCWYGYIAVVWLYELGTSHVCGKLQ